MTMQARDILLVAAEGLRSRRGRVALSATGVAIGIAAIVAVLGITESSRADLLAQLDRFGTNLLTVEPGRNAGGGTASLPLTAPTMIARIAAVHHVTAIAQLDVAVRRNDKIAPADTGSIAVVAAHPDLLAALGATIHSGRFLDGVLEHFPTVVLGSDAAGQLGIDLVAGQSQVWLDDNWFTVVGILQPLELVSNLNRAALIGYPEAQTLTHHEPQPTTIYVRADPEDVPAVQAVLAATANPAHANAVSVGRPSDVLAARAAAKSALTGLLLGLGALALLVSGLGIANVMVVAVLERRNEIGVRRALGATRSAIAGQFLTEAFLLALLGGTLGAAAGSTATIVWAHHQHWPPALSVTVLTAAIAAAGLDGAIAGLIPAIRAARLTPTQALQL